MHHAPSHLLLTLPSIGGKWVEKQSRGRETWNNLKMYLVWVVMPRDQVCFYLMQKFRLSIYANADA